MMIQRRHGALDALVCGECGGGFERGWESCWKDLGAGDIWVYFWRVAIFLSSLATGCSLIRDPILDRGAVCNYHYYSTIYA
jgi:hypothetical protein